MRPILILTMAALCAAGCNSPASSPGAAPAIAFQKTSTIEIEQGRRLSAVLGCSGCHGADLAGEDWSDPEFGRLWTANLTLAAAEYTDAELEEVIRTGRRPDRDLWGMPSHLFTQLTKDEMSAVIAFIRSKPQTGVKHPDPTFLEAAQREIAAGTFMSSPAQVAKEGGTWPPDAGEAYALGRYIVRATCAECHGLDLGGGPPMAGGASPPDLRMVAAYEPEQFLRLMRTGQPIGDRDLGLMGEVARGRYSHFTDTEIAAVHAYLRKIGTDAAAS